MSKSHSKVTRERLLELLHYEPQTGVFTWRVDRTPTVKAGDVAGTSKNSSGHHVILIDWRPYRAHRLVWLYVHGRWPNGPIDHINGVRNDNRLVNLRDVTAKINTENQRRARSDNQCGYMGVRWHRNGAWQARIGLGGGRQKHLGLFDTPEEAHAAYVAAKRQLHEGCTL